NDDGAFINSERDYFLTERSGYNALSYPHPLVSGVDDTPPPPDPDPDPDPDPEPDPDPDTSPLPASVIAITLSRATESAISINIQTPPRVPMIHVALSESAS